MGDGTDPAIDMRLPDWSYASSPLDLDGDGKEDIQYAATNANVQSVMSEITNLASADDHLFFFVIDHGGSIDHVSNSYICLWGNERLQDTSLGSMIERLTNKQVTVIWYLVSVTLEVSSIISTSQDASFPQLALAANHHGHAKKYLSMNLFINGHVLLTHPHQQD